MPKKSNQKKGARITQGFPCHGHQSGSHKSVRASHDAGVVRAMDLTRRTTGQSGIPLISSILAALGRKALHGSRYTCIACDSQRQSTKALCSRCGPVGRA
ncbi:hypothetical protein BW685_02955 [Burkholderia ubonensis]|uniref:Uncharacterized protein n=1 Tax=Burkholderia ubonensis TaxID=101571 RepID=A0A1R1JIE0_9BURK|nr:hypothetical protein BW685_02955 [Burkholderia ubonensis]